MEQLWSMSTTLREADRIIGFAKTAFELNGEIWNKENQIKYQVLLIKNRHYLSPSNQQSFNNLNNEQIELLSDLNHDFSFGEAFDIFNAKNYADPPMRGRQSLSPLKKLGLVYIKNNKIYCTDICLRLIEGTISLEEFMFDSLIKYQYPNPMESEYLNWNTKPFINTLRLIKAVNKLTVRNQIKSKGISTIEFGIFALSLKDYRQVDYVAEKIINFRKIYENLNYNQKKVFVLEYIDEYLYDFKNAKKNVFEYTDNVIRYLRLTKYIYLRGKYSNTYIDLEPRRMIEIDSLLEFDYGKAIDYSKNEWYEFIGSYGSYVLPFENPSSLKQIAKNIFDENNTLKIDLGIQPKKIEYYNDTFDLKLQILELREERTSLQNLKLKNEYHRNYQKIDEALRILQEILNRNSNNLVNKFSIELEKWANVALNIINDALLIKPNTKVGDDNEPIFTAPAGVPDIECYYQTFNSICEVTMLTGRDQWFNEGQPVMRHLREFEKRNYDKDCYCLFIAPRLHVDSLNTFMMANKYGYEGKKQKIVPITIRQLISLLSNLKKNLMNGYTVSHKDFKKLLDSCLEIELITTTSEWLNHLEDQIINENIWHETSLMV